MKVEKHEVAFEPVKIIIETPAELNFFIKLIGAMSVYDGDQFDVNIDGLFQSLQERAKQAGVYDDLTHKPQILISVR